MTHSDPREKLQLIGNNYITILEMQNPIPKKILLLRNTHKRENFRKKYFQLFNISFSEGFFIIYTFGNNFHKLQVDIGHWYFDF